jgi:hypothetical protein|tara:strand:- start:2903 stop:3076 length:174 start_codon:yes stop_codon:yes gene_type:complete
MINGAKKEVIVPSFNDWYTENSIERIQDQQKPYSRERGKEIYEELKKRDFDFPVWNR